MNTLTHTSYEKISENFNQYKLTEADYRLLKKTNWVVTEKIHGANFCILTNGKTIEYAKRKEILANHEDFFGHTQLVEQLQPKALAIFEYLKQIYPEIKQISLYGELFGGEYPHPDVEPNLSVNAVQTGIYYSPNIEFMVFDIAYEGEQIERNYLDFDRLTKICSQAHIMSTLPLFIGKYEDAFAYNIEFTTTIPTLLQLPPLDISNKAEGIVIKPAKSLFLNTAKGKLRPVVKKKISEFAEDKRFHQAQKWNYNLTVSKDKKLEINPEFIETEILSLITENRLNNVISKIGKIKNLSKKRKRHLLNSYTEDVLESFKENWSDVFEKLEASKKEEIRQLVNKKAIELISSLNNTVSQKS